MFCCFQHFAAAFARIIVMNYYPVEATLFESPHPRIAPYRQEGKEWTRANSACRYCCSRFLGVQVFVGTCLPKGVGMNFLLRRSMRRASSFQKKMN